MNFKVGLLYKFGETGTEGNYFALQENYDQDKWSYKDLHLLSNGDFLIILNKNNKVVWNDFINLDLKHALSEGHGYQKYCDDQWGNLFDRKNIGILIPKAL